jgi:hypothetical protein
MAAEMITNAKLPGSITINVTPPPVQIAVQKNVLFNPNLATKLPAKPPNMRIPTKTASDSD